MRAILLNDVELWQMVNNRINWGAHPQGKPHPYVVLHRIGGAEGYTLKGPDGLQQGRVQVDCYAPSEADATKVSRVVIAALGGYRGGGFRGVFHAGTRNSREGGSNEAERLFRVSLDFTTHWRAT